MRLPERKNLLRRAAGCLVIHVLCGVAEAKKSGFWSFGGGAGEQEPGEPQVVPDADRAGGGGAPSAEAGTTTGDGGVEILLSGAPSTSGPPRSTLGLGASSSSAVTVSQQKKELCPTPAPILDNFQKQLGNSGALVNVVTRQATAPKWPAAWFDSSVYRLMIGFKPQNEDIKDGKGYLTALRQALPGAAGLLYTGSSAYRDPVSGVCDFCREVNTAWTQATGWNQGEEHFFRPYTDPETSCQALPAVTSSTTATTTSAGAAAPSRAATTPKSPAAAAARQPPGLETSRPALLSDADAAAGAAAGVLASPPPPAGRSEPDAQTNPELVAAADAERRAEEVTVAHVLHQPIHSSLKKRREFRQAWKNSRLSYEHEYVVEDILLEGKSRARGSGFLSRLAASRTESLADGTKTSKEIRESKAKLEKEFENLQQDGWWFFGSAWTDDRSKSTVFPEKNLILFGEKKISQHRYVTSLEAMLEKLSQLVLKKLVENNFKVGRWLRKLARNAPERLRRQLGNLGNDYVDPDEVNHVVLNNDAVRREVLAYVSNEISSHLAPKTLPFLPALAGVSEDGSENENINQKMLPQWFCYLSHDTDGGTLNLTFRGTGTRLMDGKTAYLDDWATNVDAAGDDYSPVYHWYSDATTSFSEAQNPETGQQNYWKTVVGSFTSAGASYLKLHKGFFDRVVLALAELELKLREECQKELQVEHCGDNEEKTQLLDDQQKTYHASIFAAKLQIKTNREDIPANLQHFYPNNLQELARNVFDKNRQLGKQFETYLEQRLRQNFKTILVSGHSLGGAQALVLHRLRYDSALMKFLIRGKYEQSTTSGAGAASTSSLRGARQQAHDLPSRNYKEFRTIVFSAPPIYSSEGNRAVPAQEYLLTGKVPSGTPVTFLGGQDKYDDTEKLLMANTMNVFYNQDPVPRLAFLSFTDAKMVVPVLEKVFWIRQTKMKSAYETKRLLRKQERKSTAPPGAAPASSTAATPSSSSSSFFFTRRSQSAPELGEQATEASNSRTTSTSSTSGEIKGNKRDDGSCARSDSSTRAAKRSKKNPSPQEGPSASDESSEDPSLQLLSKKTRVRRTVFAVSGRAWAWFLSRADEFWGMGVPLTEALDAHRMEFFRDPVLDLAAPVGDSGTPGPFKQPREFLGEQACAHFDAEKFAQGTTAEKAEGVETQGDKKAGATSSTSPVVSPPASPASPPALPAPPEEFDCDWVPPAEFVKLQAEQLRAKQ
ncbi:unnamed protein product [Amoebophrya sp. A120]|nr:unnamed protein product [Amoebophrya sp. A120]|eukprot:GSA120T00008992001.1